MIIDITIKGVIVHYDGRSYRIKAAGIFVRSTIKVFDRRGMRVYQMNTADQNNI